MNFGASGRKLGGRLSSMVRNSSISSPSRTGPSSSQGHGASAPPSGGGNVASGNSASGYSATGQLPPFQPLQRLEVPPTSSRHSTSLGMRSQSAEMLPPISESEGGGVSRAGLGPRRQPMGHLTNAMITGQKKMSRSASVVSFMPSTNDNGNQVMEMVTEGKPMTKSHCASLVRQKLQFLEWKWPPYLSYLESLG